LDGDDYRDLEGAIGYHFQDQELLVCSLTHTSFAHEKNPECKKNGANPARSHYEQMEFLGDAVVDLVIGHLLMNKFPEAPEGDLSRLRARLVNINQLSRLAKELGLDRWVRLGKGEEITGGRNKSSILSDIYEAVCAAVYLDGGFTAAFDLIKNHFQKILETADLKLIDQDYKTQLQEIVQADFKKTPKYRLVSESGPDHEKTFEIEVMVNNQLVSRGSGKSKKEAEQDAAQNALAIIKNLGKIE
jgi:ribonuclease III